MRQAIALLVVLTVAAAATAQDLGLRAPAKAPQSYPENVPDPVRQAGDTIGSATVIPALPFDDTGTTAGYTDDYDEVCPYAGATAPDVVYKYVSVMTQTLNIDLCGSAYDTKLYVYDAGLNLIACNDDFYFSAPCGVYVSRLEDVTLNAGTTYYFIVDGYGAASGAYNFDILPCGKCACEVPCPTSGLPEDEPPLQDEYVDNFDGGCNTPGHPFKSLGGDAEGELILCGVAGWYSSQGSDLRDTDWFILTQGEAGSISVTADAEYATYLFELGPQDCDAVGVLQQTTVGPCAEASLTIGGYAPGAPVWFWAGATTFSPPSGPENEYSYVVWFSGLEPAVATEGSTWSAVKALYH